MIMVDGNIYFVAGSGRNISFQVSSGSNIQFGNTNIMNLPNSTEVAAVRKLLLDAQERMLGFETTLQTTNSEWQNKINELLQKHSILTKQVSAQANDTYQRARTNRRARLLILKLTKQIERLFKLMATDECLAVGADTCKNGGMESIVKYALMNALFIVGQQLVVKTVLNTIAGFTCNCTTGWHGLLCEHAENACDSADDICGTHGHCNGLHCLDFDECANDLTNDCSKQPPVECINTHGSYNCGECPTGYLSKGEKQGQICQKIDRCNNPPLINGGCSPLAKCVNEPEFRCICPMGMIGDGIGPDGCEKPKITINGTDESLCVENGENKSCLNGGTCQTISSKEIRCLCPETHYGVRCEHPNPCLSRQFCSGHGRCQTNPLGCICFKGFYGSRCQFQEDGCGFHTSNETGELKYERNAPTPLFDKWTCTWHIEMFDTRKVLQINFLNLTAPRLFEVTSKGCENAFVTLTIFDGADPLQSPTLASTQIANLCHGEDFEMPFKHPLFTSTNKAVIRLSSRLQGRSTFLHLNWTAKKPSCGGRFNSPNGGRIDYYYNDNRQLVGSKQQKDEELGEKGCICQIPSNRTLSLQQCFSLSAKELPTIVRTSGPFASVYLRIDGQQQFNTKLPTGCGGKIKATETSSLLQSPNYPHIYFPNLDCLWIIQPKIISENNTNDINENNLINDAPYLADQKVEILFEHFDVPTTVTQYANPLLRHVTINSCVGDFLQIVEKVSTYCNMQKPPLNLPIVAPHLSLKFHSDSSIGGSGFSIRYRSVCQKDFTLPNGTISSPNFPGPSSQPFKCTYRIIAKPSQAIRLRFDKIGFTTSFSSCFYNNRQNSPQIQDYIELSGGHSSNEVANKRYICPRYPFVAPAGEIVTSGIRPFSITYSTSGSPTNKGFLFYYETFDIGCGGVFTITEEGEQKQLITSPNYPESYTSFMYCVYYLKVPTGKAIRLSFDVFDIENVAHRDDCDFDNVRVFDTYTDDNEHGQLLGKFCGKALPPPLISNTGQMAVVFISDRSVSGSGFSAKFQSINLTSHCDRTFTASSGEFIFDFGDYEQNEHCDYKIQISSNRRILLNILNISSPCDYGTLMVKNGPSELSPGFVGLFGDSEICNENPVKQLISQGNRLFLRFRSITNRGIRFALSYEQYEAGCGGHITGFSGAISTPQYPHKDSHSLRCEWLIAVTPGNKIQFKIIKLDNLDSEDSDGNCSPFSRNLLELFDIKYGGDNRNEHLIERYCRLETTNPLPIISSSNSLNVRFSQHGGSHHLPIFGFLAEFSTVCSDILLEGLHGTLQSPGYPQRVLLPRNCKWQIRSSSGSRIQLQFHLFRITDTDNLTR
uniref:Cubilin n=1 Tax=Meloidogyne hapla TaxID=6305 RepID=A0A1I8B1I3_MELHA